jgi:hypothetical protein
MTRRASASAPALFAYRRQATHGSRISFLDVLEREAIPAWETEWRFCDRMWRFDYAWPVFKIAVEIEGGAHGRLIVIDRGHERRNGADVAIRAGTRIRVGGRHQTGPGFEADIEKYNAAAILGWMVLRATTTQVRDGHALAILRRAFAARGLE